MDQQQLKRTDDEDNTDTVNIFLEYVELEESKSGRPSKCHSRTKSVEKAKELIQLNGASKHSSDQQCDVIVTERESEGYVVLSTEPARTSATKIHLSKSRANCGIPRSTSAKRPDTLALQPAPDPGDPPLFSPCQSYPPSAVTERMPAVTPVTCPQKACSLQSRATALEPETEKPIDKTVAKRIAEKLKKIGDKIENTEQIQTVEEELSGLITQFTPSNGWSFWWNVTRIFHKLYKLLSLLKSQFGEQSPPDSDERWQLFLKTLALLRDDIIPLISSRGGWRAFLSASDSEVQLVSPQTTPPLSSRNMARSLPTAHSTPILPHCEPRTVNSPRLVPTPPCSRVLQDCQPSPGSARSQRINRSHTQPACARSETHPRKLWSLSESGSLVDEDGNEDFEESLKSDLEGSTISLGNVQKFVSSLSQSSDSDNERDDCVFQIQPDEGQTTTTTGLHSASSPAVVPAPHHKDAVDTDLYDSGIISSLDTLSLSSTPPRDISFTLGGTGISADSAVDVSTPPPAKGEKKRPRSGCSFPKPKEASPFDRARSMTMPVMRRNSKPVSFARLPAKRQSRKSSVVSASPPSSRFYSSGSLSLGSISEAVLYEAVCSLLR